MGTTSQSTSRRRWIGDYEIIRPIGRGGIAVVHLARQASLDRGVALKELNSFQVGSPDMAERFVRESRIAGSLNHPNIATVFEYFEHDGVPYIAMEYLPRGSLRPYVGCLSLAQFVGVMEGVLSGLAHAQTLGIVHRDLKPENLLVTDEGRVKITDFGIAKATQKARAGTFATTTGTTVGTPTYMAPEQAMAQEVGAWTDLYSVGVMAWEHMTGRVPFHDAEAAMIVVMRHINEPIPPAIEVSPHTDPEISQWIDRLLTKDPHSRPHSPAAVWDELEEIAIRRLGPRWRTGARLPTSTQILDTPPPLTPAPFDSQQGPKAPADAVESATPTSSYVTFDRAPRRPAPDPESTTLRPPSEAPVLETAPEPLTLPPSRAPAGSAEPLEPSPARAEGPAQPEPAAPAESAPSNEAEEPRGEATSSGAKRLRVALRLAALAAATGAAAFAATGLTTSGPARAPGASTVSSGTLAISLPADWQLGPARSLPGLTPADELLVRPQAALDELLAIETLPTTDATLLPSSLLAVLPGHTASGDVVALGRYRFYRYRDLTPRGSSQVETVYALPTTTGTVVATCGADAATAPFMAACEHVVGTLVLGSGGALRLGPTHAYAAALEATIDKLNAATHAAQTMFNRAHSAKAQAAAASQLEAAYRQATLALPKVGPESVAQPTQAAFKAALMATATRYSQLAHAAAANDGRAYEAARESTARAQATLGAALAHLGAFGYQPRRTHT